jgi:Nucleotide-diphospho-sugar transferase
MTNIIYTVCTYNHLPQAKLMLDSFLKFNPLYKTFIGMVDKNLDINDKKTFTPHEIIEASIIEIFEFEEMLTNYNALELSCALKSYFAKHLIQKTNCNHLVYADTDIIFFNTINKALLEAGDNSILITPHYYTPPPNDSKIPLERDTLRSGIYNAGFYILKNDNNTILFLDWWMERMKDQCYYNFAEGMGVDQNWFNLIPLYFNNVIISKNKGLNVAYWNLHERELSIVDNVYKINNSEELIFLHISGFDDKQPIILSKHQNRYLLQNHKILEQLFIEYSSRLNTTQWEKFRSLPYYYISKQKKKSKIGKLINSILKPLGYSIVKI